MIPLKNCEPPIFPAHHVFSLMLAIILLFVVMATDGRAQFTGEDTLDWRGYYPLQVGNVWELKQEVISNGGIERETNYLRLEITGDTLINDRTFYIHTAKRYELRKADSTLKLDFNYTDYVRYDTANKNLYAIPADSARRRDTLHQGWPGSPFMYDRVGLPATCNMEADFGEEIQCYSSSHDDSNKVFVTGGYYPDNIGPISYNAEKSFSAGEHTNFRFYHGFGPSGNILYARVDGMEYGQSKIIQLSAGKEYEEQSTATPFKLLSTYPNPAGRNLTVRFSLQNAREVTLSIYNLLGRQVRRAALPELPAGRHNYRFKLETLPPGTYILNLSGQSSKVSGSFHIVQ